MADTIEWLETIGKSAALRRAPAEELVETLELTDATDALKTAVMSGDRSWLFAELGHKSMRVQDMNGPSHEEEPDHDHDEHTPVRPPHPDQDQPPRDQ
ncbi:MAG TPA: hypothetical protein VMA74_17135 [Dyella sp.]|uniref:hypothetical protein n=1 Tax=Dyella sp. TaxID=1869338 RepID=UPI002CDEF54E|nr:hypothetical protein [Dyella sp.]HUB91449.1 hypothetical protein [Dyella sp.]